MIHWINSLLDSTLFKYVRFGQFALALTIFTFAALMPADFVTVKAADHSMHFIGNVLLYMSASLALFGRMKAWILVLLLIPYTFAIELAQWLAPSRHVDMVDLMYNAAGLFTGFFIVAACVWVWGKLSAGRAGYGG